MQQNQINSLKVRGLDPIEPKEVFSEPPAPLVGRQFPKYVTASKTRHGKTVHYFRRDRKTPRIRLWAEPGSPEFMAEYLAARNGHAAPPSTLIYFARAGNKVKIGISRNPRVRLGGLRTGSSSKVRIYYVTPGDRTKESELHRLFAEHRGNGEWFLYAAPIREWIAQDEARRAELPKFQLDRQMADLQKLLAAGE